MEFNLPTTKAQMYSILNDLYYYYRIRREGFEEVNLQPLELTRLVFNPKTVNEINSIAETMIESEHQRELMKYRKDLERELYEIDVKLANADSNYQIEIDSIEQLFEQSVKKIQAQARKAGLFSSNIVIDKTAQLESDKNLKIASVLAKKNNTVAELTAKQQYLTVQLQNADADYESLYEFDKAKKVEELLDAQSALTREVFIYNNGLDEKEQRYENTIKQTKASLEIRFLDVTSGEFTKEQLVEMGYYEDVMRCVSGYYDTLAPADAYRSIFQEKKLAIYLDDYYESMVYLYKTNSGI